MDDGVELAVGVSLPAGEGPFPSVLEYTAYRLGDMPDPDHRHEHLLDRGYAIVRFDVRGTGASGGTTTEVYSDREIDDAVAVVHWIAAQPWSDGAVGMMGLSFGGVVCLQVARRAPEPLRAIVVRSGTDDVHGEWVYPGGALRPYLFTAWLPHMLASNFAPPRTAWVGADWAAVWQQRLDGNVPYSLAMLEHQCDDEHWRRKALRPLHAQVTAATMVIGGWADWYPTPLLRTFAGVTTPRRAIIGPWTHFWPDHAYPGPAIDGMREIERWFARFLKDEETGVLDEPPVSVFRRTSAMPTIDVRQDEGEWIGLDGWPDSRIVQQRWSLGSGARLLEPDATEDGETVVTFRYDPTVGATTGKHGGDYFKKVIRHDLRPDEVLGPCFDGPVLEQPLDLIGDAVAELTVSSSAPDGYFFVRLGDVAPDGTSMLITRGGLLLSRRDGRTSPSLVEPGTVHRLEVPLLSCAYRVPVGHRLRLSIAGADLENAWPPPYAAEHRIHLGGVSASSIRLPVLDPQVDLPVPEFAPSPVPISETPELRFEVVRDQMADTVTSRTDGWTGSASRAWGRNHTRFTVSRRDPAVAEAFGEYEFDVPLPIGTMSVRARSVLTSDAEAFHHLCDVTFTVAGAEHTRRSWAASVPRVPGALVGGAGAGSGPGTEPSQART
jgi:putative CocE/NonD family hydrolase